MNLVYLLLITQLVVVKVQGGNQDRKKDKQKKGNDKQKQGENGNLYEGGSDGGPKTKGGIKQALLRFARQLGANKSGKKKKKYKTKDKKKDNAKDKQKDTTKDKKKDKKKTAQSQGDEWVKASVAAVSSGTSTNSQSPVQTDSSSSSDSEQQSSSSKSGSDLSDQSSSSSSLQSLSSESSGPYGGGGAYGGIAGAGGDGGGPNRRGDGGDPNRRGGGDRDQHKKGPNKLQIQFEQQMKDSRNRLYGNLLGAGLSRYQAHTLQSLIGPLHQVDVMLGQAFTYFLKLEAQLNEARRVGGRDRMRRIEQKTIINNRLIAGKRHKMKTIMRNLVREGLNGFQLFILEEAASFAVQQSLATVISAQIDSGVLVRPQSINILSFGTLIKQKLDGINIRQLCVQQKQRQQQEIAEQLTQGITDHTDSEQQEDDEYFEANQGTRAGGGESDYQSQSDTSTRGEQGQSGRQYKTADQLREQLRLEARQKETHKQHALHKTQKQADLQGRKLLQLARRYLQRISQELKQMKQQRESSQRGEGATQESSQVLREQLLLKRSHSFRRSSRGTISRPVSIRPRQLHRAQIEVVGQEKLGAFHQQLRQLRDRQQEQLERLRSYPQLTQMVRSRHQTEQKLLKSTFQRQQAQFQVRVSSTGASYGQISQQAPYRSHAQSQLPILGQLKRRPPFLQQHRTFVIRTVHPAQGHQGRPTHYSGEQPHPGTTTGTGTGSGSGNRRSRSSSTSSTSSTQSYKSSHQAKGGFHAP